MLAFCVPTVCSAAELFSSARQKTGLLKALAKQDDRYDPVEKMIRRPFSSPGYHTTLKGGYVHPSRDSLNYAVALLDSGQPARLKRAQNILRKVISLQDQYPESRTYGIWSWFAEEPLDKMSPPDWNWADFCGTQLLQVARDHMHRLPDDLQQQVKDSIIHAAYSIKRRNVGPGYTNIALMGTYVTLTAGELFGVDELSDYGKARLKRFHDYTFEQGSFREYNSPTYTVVAIREISRMLRHVRDPESQELLRRLNWQAWYHVARRFHPPTKQWAGPHSRCYATLLRDSTKAFIQRATNGKVSFMPDNDAWESIDAHRIGAACHPEHSHYFTRLSVPRHEVEVFAKNPEGANDIIGTTYLHPDYTLGSVNIGDLWNQRRPLLAYWNTDAGVVAMRLRCLHDDYDYSSASIFTIQNKYDYYSASFVTIQDKSDILGAVVFATDRGDTHISLDRLKNATIKASDLRIRLQFEGAVDDMKLPDKVQLNHTTKISSGRININFQIAHAVFGDNPIRTEVGRDDKTTWLDVVLYNGIEKDINFAEISEAAVIFALSISPHSGPVQRDIKRVSVLSVSQINDIIKADWQINAKPYMSLTVPQKPLSSAKQRTSCSARFNRKNPWKAPVK